MGRDSYQPRLHNREDKNKLQCLQLVWLISGLNARGLALGQ